MSPVIASAAKQSSSVTSVAHITLIPRPWRFCWIAASRYALLAMTVGILCLPLPAYAQRMHDYSLSPQQSLEQPNISHAQPGNINSYFNQGFNTEQAPEQPSTNSGVYSATPSNRFMSGYCDPNFHPMIVGHGNLGSLQSCLNQKKQQTCQEFQQLPADAQNVLDQSISCAYTAANSDEDNTGNSSDCSVFDGRRLQLLKKYSDDAATTHALIYMQDDVLNAGSSCMGGGR